MSPRHHRHRWVPPRLRAWSHGRGHLRWSISTPSKRTALAQCAFPRHHKTILTLVAATLTSPTSRHLSVEGATLRGVVHGSSVLKPDPVRSTENLSDGMTNLSALASSKALPRLLAHITHAARFNPRAHLHHTTSRSTASGVFRTSFAVISAPRPDPVVHDSAQGHRIGVGATSLALGPRSLCSIVPDWGVEAPPRASPIPASAAWV